MITFRDAQYWHGGPVWGMCRAGEILVQVKERVDIRPGKTLGTNQLYAFLMNTGAALFKKDFVSGSYYYTPKQIHIDAGRMKEGVTETKQENRSGEIDL